MHRAVSEQAHLYEKVHHHQWDDDGRKDGRGNQDDNDGAHYVEEGHEEGPQGPGDGLVDGVDVLGEPVQDASQGRGVEERHGGAEDIGKHAVVEVPRGTDGADGQGKGAE